MPTIAEMITRRLREIDAQFSAEVSTSQPRASGGAGASERADAERPAEQAGMAGLGGDLHGNGAGYFPVSALLRAPLDGNGGDVNLR